MTEITTITTTANDNTPETDEQHLQRFLSLFEEGRISINTGFVPDEETGYLTQQVLEVSCGEYTMVSAPQPLAIPLMTAPIAETGITLN
jgi:hypothetical protein